MKYNERGESRIEVSDILNYFKDIDSYYNDCTRYDTLKRMLEDIVAETKEDAERKTGQWIEYDNSHCECPLCHEEWSYFDNDVERFYYCPNCGAKME